MVVVLAACGDDIREPIAPKSPVGLVPPTEQREGDIFRGRNSVVEAGYTGCGIPLSAYRDVFGMAPPDLRLPGRTGTNAELPFHLTAFTARSGVRVVAPNCLQCHAERLNGQIVIGLGNHTTDYTVDYGSSAESIGSLVTDPAERVEWAKWASRLKAAAPYTQTETIGVNNADHLSAVLYAHRDPQTLAWTEEARMTLPSAPVVPVDVPPWWHMKKKHAMYHVGAGRGDHARIMMSHSTLCLDNLEDAAEVDAYFPDIRAYVASIEPPAWPFAIDRMMLVNGRSVYERACAGCHGSPEAYPNVIVSYAAIGTDPELAKQAGQFADRYLNWFSESFFGEIATLAPAPGYYAPPLDGVWATAPYLHNGSVPTLRALLDSSRRPKFFTRSYDPNDYDREAVGWRFTELAGGQDAPPNGMRPAQIYDTTLRGYSNAGHLYGDSLRPDERDALIEYLKTL